MKLLNRDVRFVSLIFYLFFAAGFLGCAGTGGLQDPHSMGPKEFAVYINQAYVSSYDDYLMQVQRQDLSEAQKDVLRKKKQVLTEVWPQIRLYNRYINTGVLPEQELKDTIIKLLEKLLNP